MGGLVFSTELKRRCWFSLAARTRLFGWRTAMTNPTPTKQEVLAAHGRLARYASSPDSLCGYADGVQARKDAATVRRYIESQPDAQGEAVSWPEQCPPNVVKLVSREGGRKVTDFIECVNEGQAQRLRSAIAAPPASAQVRAALAEMVDYFSQYSRWPEPTQDEDSDKCDAVLSRARAALAAAPQPEGKT
jgi:hypothetical protein